MPAVVKELEAQETQAKTFKQATPVSDKYHYLQIIVGPIAMPDGTKTQDMLADEITYWLNAGFTLKFEDYLGDHKGAGGEFIGRVHAYHFVKE